MISELVVPIVQSLGICGLIVHALVYLGKIILAKEEVTHYPSDKVVPKIIRTEQGKEFDLNTARFIFSYNKGLLKVDVYLTHDNNWVALVTKRGTPFSTKIWTGINTDFATPQEWIKTRMIEHKGEAFAAKYFPEIYDFKATI